MGIIKQKICLLGSFGVGKTSLMERFVNDRFDEKYLSTVGVSVSQKLMPPIAEEQSAGAIQFLFLIWDIAGLEKFDAAVLNYFRGASGALAVADLTRPESIDNLGPIVEKFISVNPQSALVVVGNKLDRVIEPQPEPAVLTQLAARYAANTVLTSAKTGAGVEAAFVSLAKKIEVPDGKPV